MAIEKLLAQAKDDLDESSNAEANDIADALLEEARRPHPKSSVLNGLLAALKGVCNTTNMAAAVLTIEQFVRSFVG